MDVSNSVDDLEHRLQVDRLTGALEDPVVISRRVALAALQWSDSVQRCVTPDWRQRSPLRRCRGSLPRSRHAARLRDGRHRPAEALPAALQLMERVRLPPQGIDVLADGMPNDGGDVGAPQRQGEAMGVTINGLAIESFGLAITDFNAAAPPPATVSCSPRAAIATIPVRSG